MTSRAAPECAKLRLQVWCPRHDVTRLDCAAVTSSSGIIQSDAATRVTMFEKGAPNDRAGCDCIATPRVHRLRAKTYISLRALRTRRLAWHSRSIAELLNFQCR